MDNLKSFRKCYVIQTEEELKKKKKEIRSSRINWHYRSTLQMVQMPQIEHQNRDTLRSTFTAIQRSAVFYISFYAHLRPTNLIM